MSTQLLALHPGISRALAVTNTAPASTSATPFSVGTRVVRVAPLVDVWVRIGPSPTASASGNSLFMPANSVEYFEANAGECISAIANTDAAGTVSVTEMSR